MPITRVRWWQYLTGIQSILPRRVTTLHRGEIMDGIEIQDLGKNNTVNINEKSLFKNCLIKFVDNNSIITIGKNCRLSGLNIVVRNNSVLHIHDGCRITGMITCKDNSKLVIQKNMRVTGRLGCHAVEGSNITIGEDCLIAKARIRTSDMHSIIDLTTNKRINIAADITIGNHVWLCEDTYIGKGVSIADNVVIGAKSIVTKDIEANCIAAGVPAKVIKRNITWDYNLI